MCMLLNLQLQCFPYIDLAATDCHRWNNTAAADFFLSFFNEERGEVECGFSLISLETNIISFCAMDASYPGQSHTCLKDLWKSITNHSGHL